MRRSRCAVPFELEETIAGAPRLRLYLAPRRSGQKEEPAKQQRRTHQHECPHSCFLLWLAGNISPCNRKARKVLSRPQTFTRSSLGSLAFTSFAIVAFQTLANMISANPSTIEMKGHHAASELTISRGLYTDEEYAHARESTTADGLQTSFLLHCSGSAHPRLQHTRSGAGPAPTRPRCRLGSQRRSLCRCRKTVARVRWNRRCGGCTPPPA